jgi:hypothetical protein
MVSDQDTHKQRPGRASNSLIPSTRHLSRFEAYFNGLDLSDDRGGYAHGEFLLHILVALHLYDLQPLVNPEEIGLDTHYFHG